MYLFLNLGFLKCKGFLKWNKMKILIFSQKIQLHKTQTTSILCQTDAFVTKIFSQ